MDGHKSHQRLFLLEGSVSAPRNTYLGAHLPGRQESGQSRTSGKRGRETNWLTNTETQNLARGEQLSAQTRKAIKRWNFWLVTIVLRIFTWSYNCLRNCFVLSNGNDINMCVLCDNVQHNIKTYSQPCQVFCRLCSVRQKATNRCHYVKQNKIKSATFYNRCTIDSDFV